MSFILIHNHIGDANKMIKIKKKNNYDERIQCECFHDWLVIKNIWHHHSPNGELRRHIQLANGKIICPTGSKLKRMGTSAGFPDYIIPYSRGGYHGLYIEMKSGNGKLSPAQKVWLEFLTQQNYLALSCKGWLEAVKITEDYFKFVNN